MYILHTYIYIVKKKGLLVDMDSLVDKYRDDVEKNLKIKSICNV